MIKTLPDCMMPDGAEPCLGYRKLEKRVKEMETAAHKSTKYWLNKVKTLKKRIEELESSVTIDPENPPDCPNCERMAERVEELEREEQCMELDFEAADRGIKYLQDRVKELETQLAESKDKVFQILQHEAEWALD